MLRPARRDHFAKAGYPGSILIHNRAYSSWHVNDNDHADTGYLPCLAAGQPLIIGTKT